MLDEQMSWYASQPASYRRAWWAWAADQPNFREMLAWAKAQEKDSGVLRMMEAVEHGRL